MLATGDEQLLCWTSTLGVSRNSAGSSVNAQELSHSTEWKRADEDGLYGDGVVPGTWADRNP